MTQASESDKRGHLQRFVDGHTGWPIAISVLLGVALVVGALVLLARACGNDAAFICQMAKASPPWIPLATLMAAPLTTLGIYWRTAHRKRDLGQKDIEQAHKERELSAKEVEVAEARQSSIRQRLATARADLAGATGTPVADRAAVLAAVGDLERIGRDRDFATDSAEAIADFLRAVLDPVVHYDRDEADDIEESDRITKLRQRCVAAIRTIRGAHPTVALDLQGARLWNLDMRGIDLRHADLRGANLYRADLRGCQLDEANVMGGSAPEAILDWLPNAEHTQQYILLITSGAFMLKDGRRTDGSGRVVEE